MGIKLHESGEVTICAKADPARPFTTRLISRRTRDWVIANVKISDTEGSRHGARSVQITITFDAAICEPSETMSWTK